MSNQYVEDASRSSADAGAGENASASSSSSSSPLVACTWLDANTTATLSSSGTLTTWDLTRRVKRKRVVNVGSKTGMDTGVLASLHYSAESRSLLVHRCVSAGEAEFTLVDGGSLAVVAHETISTSASAVALDPSGEVFAVGGEGGVVNLYRAKEDTFGTRLGSDPSPSSSPTTTALAFSSPNTSLLAAGTQHGDVHLYRLEGQTRTPRLLVTYNYTHRADTPVSRLAFDPDDDHLYVALSDGRVVLYDVGVVVENGKGGSKTTTTATTTAVVSAAVAASSSPAQIWQPSATRTHHLEPTLLSASSDGSTTRVLLTASMYDATIHLWDMTRRGGVKAVKLASVDVDVASNSSGGGGIAPRGVLDVKWRPAAATKTAAAGAAASRRSRGAFVAVTAEGVVWFRSAGEAGVDVDIDVDDGEDGEDDEGEEVVVETAATADDAAQAPVVAGDV